MSFLVFAKTTDFSVAHPKIVVLYNSIARLLGIDYLESMVYA